MIPAASHRPGLRSGIALIGSGSLAESAPPGPGSPGTGLVSFDVIDQLTAPLTTDLVIAPSSTPQFFAISRYLPLSIRLCTAFCSTAASGEPFGTAQPYGAESKAGPAFSSLPSLCLIAYAVTGESADTASTWPSISALVAALCSSKALISMAG